AEESRLPGVGLKFEPILHKRDSIERMREIESKIKRHARSRREAPGGVASGQRNGRVDRKNDRSGDCKSCSGVQRAVSSANSLVMIERDPGKCAAQNTDGEGRRSLVAEPISGKTTRQD